LKGFLIPRKSLLAVGCESAAQISQLSRGPKVAQAGSRILGPGLGYGLGRRVATSGSAVGLVLGPSRKEIKEKKRKKKEKKEDSLESVIMQIYE